MQTTDCLRLPMTALLLVASPLTIPCLAQPAEPPAAPDCSRLDPGARALANTLGLSQSDLQLNLQEFFDSRRGSREDQRASLEVAAAAVKEQKSAETARAVAETTTTAAPPDAFGARVSGSLTEFLAPFQFAVNTISTSDDKESVTVVFNPIEGELGNLSFKATLVEPEVSMELLEAIDETAREEQKEALEGMVADYDDITYTATFGYRRSDRGARREWGKTRWLWGRDPSLYDGLVDDLMSAVLQPVFDDLDEGIAAASTKSGLLAAEIVAKLDPDTPLAQRSVTKFSVAQVLAASRPGCPLADVDVQGYFESLTAHAQVLSDLSAQLNERVGLDTLSSLISNQPQLVVDLSYRNRDELVGPDSFAGTLKWEMGGRNVNSVLKQYGLLEAEATSASSAVLDDSARTELRYRALSTVTQDDRQESEKRYILSASWKRVGDYDVTYGYEQSMTDPMTMEETTTQSEAMVSLDSRTEVQGKFQFTRLVPNLFAPGGLGEPAPRLTLTVEYTDISDDPMMRDRLLAAIEYALPVQGGVSIPVTLSYANHSRFLGEQDEDLTAHIGLSYKLKGAGSSGQQ